MKFIVDTQLPPRLAFYLTSKGHESIHTTSFPEGHLLQDSEIIDWVIILIYAVMHFLVTMIIINQTGSIPQITYPFIGQLVYTNITGRKMLSFC